jgi:hypothetical protein
MSAAHEPFDELAAGYALGALDGEDLARFRAHWAAGCAQCERLVIEFDEGLARMASDLRAAPPAGVKARVTAWMGEPGAAVVAPAPAPRRRGRRAAGFLAWAASLLLAAGLGAWGARTYLVDRYEVQVQTVLAEANTLRAQLSEQGRTLAGLREQVNVQEATLTTLRQKVTEQEQTLTLVRAQAPEQERALALLRDPTTRLVVLDGLAPSPKAQGRMIWNPTAGGFLHAFNLPLPPEGKVYELWAIAGKTPIPAGLFTVDATGSGSLGVAPLAGQPAVGTFAVTLEAAGGAPAPTGPMYLASKSA